MRSQDRGILAPGEIPLDLAGLGSRQHADVGARKQGLDAGNIAGEEPRLDDPEDGPLGQQRLGLTGGGDCHDDMRLVRRERQALYRAEYDVLVFEL